MTTTLVLPRIKAVRAYVGAAAGAAGAAASASADKNSGDYHDVDDSHWILGNMYDPSSSSPKDTNNNNSNLLPIANPMSLHSELYMKNRKSWGINALGSIVVVVEAQDGTLGYGVSIGGEPAAYIIEKHLSRFVEGQNPSAVELMHDQMMRASVNYGRKGVAVQAISAVDIACWDLLGKLTKRPVMELLGGPVRQSLPVYCTTSRPDCAKALGFVGAKIPLPYGPSAGDVGLRKNVAYLSAWREKVGPDFPLALDMYMSCTASYTMRLVDECTKANINIKWFEESCPPDDYCGYKRMRESIPGWIPLSGGEHEYTLQGFAKLIATGINIIQPDVTWCGGVTTYRKIVALAEAHGDVMVVPHGSSIYSYHCQMSSLNTPCAEFINIHPDGTGLQSFMAGIVEPGCEPLPVQGHISASELNKPGFGVTYNLDKMVRPYPRSAAESASQFERNANPPEFVRGGMPF